MDYITPPPRTLGFAFTQHFRVIHALMLRDIKTRMGASYFGFLLGMLLPLGHIGALLTIYIVLGKHAPIGTDVIIYLTTGILPFIVWSYTHKKVMYACTQNRALTAFPIVKFSDILIARAIVELLNATLIVLVVVSALLVLGHDIFMYDPPGVLYTLIMAYLFGVSTGFIFGIMTQFSQNFILAGFLLVPLTWATCGVFFLPEAIPQQIREIILIFPVSHIVDFGRTAFYGEYLSDYANLTFVHLMIVVNFAVAFTINYFFKAQITAK